MVVNNMRLAALVTAILMAATFRLLPHPPNFSPIAAMALFGGAFMPRKALGILVPLAAMLLSDLVLGFHASMPFVYAAVALTSVLGWWLATNRTLGRVGIAAVLASVLFFLVTNFGVWASQDMYPHTLAGLGACFVAALPFFQNTLAGDLVFTALLFGGFALLERAVPRLREEPVPAAA
jgi:hypothetical protein